MLRPGLLAVAALAALSSVAFFAVAWRLQRRRVAEDAKFAARDFALWWYAIGVYALLSGGVVNGLAAMGLADARVLVTVRSVALVVLLGGLWHLGCHLAFLFTGGQRWRAPLGLFYAATYVATAFAFSGSLAVGAQAGAFDTRIVYAPPPSPALLAAVTLALTVPQLAGALAYGALLRRLQDATQRYRVLLVSVSLSAWFAGALVAALSDPDSPVILARPILGLVAAAAVTAAYAPPAWVQRRFGVHPLVLGGAAS